MNFESKFILLTRRSNLIFYRIRGLFYAKNQITIKIHIISSKYNEKITSENQLNRIKIRPQCVRLHRNLGTSWSAHTGILGPDGILGRPKIPDFIFCADSESEVRFLIAWSPKIPVSVQLRYLFLDPADFSSPKWQKNKLQLRASLQPSQCTTCLTRQVLRFHYIAASLPGPKIALSFIKKDGTLLELKSLQCAI